MHPIVELDDDPLPFNPIDDPFSLRHFDFFIALDDPLPLSILLWMTISVLTDTDDGIFRFDVFQECCTRRCFLHHDVRRTTPSPL